MKLPLSQCAALAFLVACGSASGQTVSGNDLVRIEVRVQSDQDRKDIAKSSADTVTQHKTFNIVLSGKAKSPEARTGKWTAYGRSLKGSDLTVLESGEFKVDLTSASQKIESKVSTTYTPEHATVSTTRSRSTGTSGGTSRTTAKKVAATGTKFVGFGVVVKDGERIVGEYFDPAGLKAEVAK